MENLEKFKQFGKRANGIILSNEDEKNSVVYTRVSTKEQAENNLSLTTQKNKCNELAIKNGHTVYGHFGGTYESAASDERKEFKRMLTFIRKSKVKINYIIVYSLDRFSRTGAGAISIAKELREEGVKVISVTQPVDVSTSSGVFQQNMHFIFGQYDNDQRRDKCITGMIERLRRGDWVGHAPFGYDNITISGVKKVIINAAGEVIKIIFHMKAVEGKSNAEIVDYCISRGIKKINLKRLTVIFKNPFYCGIIVHRLLNGEAIKGNHEPLISEEIFFRTNELTSMHRQGYTVQAVNENLPMKGFIRCSDCGGKMTGYKNKLKQLHYYKCSTKGCLNNINVEYCHKQFKNLTDAFKVDHLLIPQLKAQLKRTFNNMNLQNKEQEEVFLRQKREVQKKLDTINERFVLGEIDRQMYEQFKSRYMAEMVQVDKELDKTTQKTSNLDYFIDSSINITQNINALWDKSPYEMKQKIQNLVFPEGISFNKKNNTYLTPRINSYFAAITGISTSYATTENEKRDEIIPLSSSVAGVGLEPTTFGL